MSIERRTIAQSHNVQSGLAAILDELTHLMDEQSKLIKLIQSLTKENEKLRIQLQECQLDSANVFTRSRAKTVNGKSIE